MARLDFTVPGKPVPQPRPRITTRGNFAHAYTPKSHPITSYREAIRKAAIAAGAKPHKSLVVVFVDASFLRPPSHSNKNTATKWQLAPTQSKKRQQLYDFSAHFAAARALAAAELALGPVSLKIV